MTVTITLVIFLSAITGMGILFLTGTEKELESVRNIKLINEIDDLLPQTQCRECGYPGCRPYAEAIVAREADINRCPPGGENTIRLVAELMGRTPVPLDPGIVNEGPARIAYIDEQTCIGCVKCIIACPVDAIIGASRQMHTVMPKICTGCELCIEPCPVNCISMVPAETKIKKFVWNKPQLLPQESRT